MLSPATSRSSTSTSEVKETSVTPASVPTADWFRETTIGPKTTREHLYTVNATVYRVKNASKFINIVKEMAEACDLKPGECVTLLSRRRGRLLAKAEIAAYEMGAKPQE